MARAIELSGWTVGDVAASLDWDVPPDLRRAKGYIGQLLEAALGAPDNHHQGPDFDNLGVELKTIPIRADGRPVESTWVTRASLQDAAEQPWEGSAVQCKLQCVLWIPILTEPGVPPGARQIGSPLLWRPSVEEEATLRRDWQDIMERIMLGGLSELDASIGDALQLRPKGATARELAPAVDREGRPTMAQARGFYLRARFTRTVLAAAFGLQR
ncbi:MAG: DNA mismatch repair endonuclease MutH [Myxococcales bacterium]|nr:DNA mismatch repair endonuclease MutH [Myxococcales bacterium]